MKNLICFLALLFVMLPGFSQEKAESVIASAGNTLLADCGSMDWIVGANLIDQEVLFGVNAPKPLQSEIKKTCYTVFPTLTRDKVYVLSDKSENNDLFIRLVDLTGRLLFIRQWESNPAELDLMEYVSGTYILQLIESEGEAPATFMIVKK